MKITREDVLRVAELANLELSEAEVDTYLPQLDSILTYIEKLNELDTTGVEPMTGGCVAPAGPGQAHPSEENPALREDVARVAGVAEAALRVAPDPKAPYFRVPKVIER